MPKWRNYGQYLGNRYKNKANIIWQFGNDNLDTNSQHAIVRGIKEAGDTHLMTVNWRPGFHQLGSSWVRKYSYGEDWIDLDAWYENAPTTESGAACYWQKIEYQRSNPMPSFQTEGPYQWPDPKSASDLDIRMQNYYVALGGGCGGHVYGSGWLADEWDYDTYKNNGGRVQTIHFKNLLASRDWTLSGLQSYLRWRDGAIINEHDGLRGQPSIAARSALAYCRNPQRRLTCPGFPDRDCAMV